MPPKLGIIAGGGALPAYLITACRQSGRGFFVIALEGQADHPAIGEAPHAWLRLGAAEEGLDALRQHGVEEVVFAGRVRRPSLRELRPDRRAAKLLAKASLSALGDDGMIRAIIQEFESLGFRVVDVNAILQDLIAVEGVYGACKPDRQARDDIARGIEVACGIGALDFGQAAVVQAGVVLGAEAAEGTDALIARCAELRREGPGGVLVKMCKPGQERRTDLPTIGPETIERAAAAGLRGVAVEAGGALVLDKTVVIETADRLGLFVVGVAAKGHQRHG